MVEVAYAALSSVHCTPLIPSLYLFLFPCFLNHPRSYRLSVFPRLHALSSERLSQLWRSTASFFYLSFQMILKIPVLIVTIYVASSIYSYKGRNNCGDYQCSLRDLPFGFLLSGLIAALLCAIIDGILTAALRRFRLLLSGVSSVMLAREDRHHPRTVVATAPQQFVYTTSSANVEYIPANDKTIPVDPTQQPRFAYHETEIPQPQPYLNPSAPPPYPNPSAPQLYSYPSAPQPPPEYKL
ncbi:hypothetical protein RB195_013343 [Necator americanus]|uniref:Frizzled/Smoothened transmembrane domain-containing protein n=1 Tax=Necator americanus TaxID=51031 RepID=A0ABR1DXS8_NECAM